MSVSFRWWKEVQNNQILPLLILTDIFFFNELKNSCFNFNDSVFNLHFVWTTKLQEQLPILSVPTSGQLKKFYHEEGKKWILNICFFHNYFSVVLFGFCLLASFWVGLLLVCLGCLGFFVCFVLGFYFKCSYWISIMPTALCFAPPKEEWDLKLINHEGAVLYIVTLIMPAPNRSKAL